MTTNVNRKVLDMNERFSSPEQLLTPQEKEATIEELQEKLRDPGYLPTRQEITDAFPPRDTHFDRCLGDRFCRDKEHPVFEFLNQEYIEALADYLEQCVEELGATKDEPITILEVGAGDGRLTHFLKQKLEERSVNARIIATDSGEKGIKPDFPVEKLDYKEALKKYNPTIVIACWMPPERDWTAEFRATKSVKEILLIGETDWGCCGDAWLTWGKTWKEEYKGKTPPYKADGFGRQDLEELSKLQICRSDEPGYYYNSSTISFGRER